jgi:hypothetical protein
MADARSIFKGLKEAKASVQGNYERPGRYLERIDRMKIGTNFKKEDFLAVEKTIVRVINDDVGRGHGVGEQVTHMMMVKHPSFLGNVKAMLAGILAMKPEEIDDDAAIQACDDKQPLAGALIEVHSVNIKTGISVKNPNGNDFTKVTYLKEIKPAEALQLLTPEEKTKFFPGEYLEKIAAGQPATPPVAPERMTQHTAAPAPVPTPAPRPVANAPVPCAQPAGYDPAPAGYQFAIQDGKYVFIPA